MFISKEKNYLFNLGFFLQECKIIIIIKRNFLKALTEKL